MNNQSRRQQCALKDRASQRYVRASSPSLRLSRRPVTIVYEVEGQPYEGYYAEPEGEAMGLVLVIHDWDGLDAYEEKRADMLAEQGYTACAVDLYGQGNRPDTVEARKAEVGKLYDDREAMRSRIFGGLAMAREQTDLPAVVKAIALAAPPFSSWRARAWSGRRGRWHSR